MMRSQLLRLIDFLTPGHRKKWAQAMRAEISSFSSDREAFSFALGCLIACIRFHLELEISPGRTWNKIMKDRFTIATFISGTMACLIGLFYLTVSGAPSTMTLINGAAMLLGILLAIAVMVSVRITNGFVTMVAITGSLALLGTATFGHAIADAKRWVLMGPFFIQTSLMLLPLIALCFARIQSLWTTSAVIIAGLAMAIQPDRAMAAMLFAAVAVICWMRPKKLTFAAAICCAIGFVTTLFLPDRLPAVPFVDHILWTAFDLNILVGLSLWIGCLTLIGPVFFLPKSERNTIHFAFATCWFVMVAAAAMGAYPTPIVGYGASAIIGYFLSLIFVQPVQQSHSTVDAATTSLSDTDSEDLPLRNSSPALAY